MGFRERIKKINIKGIWERNAFYILLAVCILIMGGRGVDKPLPPGSPRPRRRLPGRREWLLPPRSSSQNLNGGSTHSGHSLRASKRKT